MVDIRDKLKVLASSLSGSTNYSVVTSTEESGSFIRHWVPTKSTLLNLLLGEENFGVPVGRMIELFGEFSHGKSSLAELIMIAFQDYGGVSVLLDAESTFVAEYAAKHGFDANSHLYLEADSVESGFSGIKDVSRRLIETFGGSVPAVFNWDTIAASPTDKEKGGDDDRMAAKAAVIRQNLRVLSRLLPKVPASVIFVNQTIDQLGTQFKRKTTPGGSGIKFWSTFRLKVSKVKVIQDPATKQGIGFIAEVTTVKSKLSPPHKTVYLPIMFETGLDPLREMINYHLDNTRIVNVAGAYKKIIDFPNNGEYVTFLDKDINTLEDTYPGLLSYLTSETKLHWFGGAHG